MPKLSDYSDPNFLEEAAAALKKEVERIEARAATLKSKPRTEAESTSFDTVFAEFRLEVCSQICGECCFCPPC